MSNKITTEEFITKAKFIHGDKYIYSLSLYTTSKDKIKIICPIHGEFEQTPNAHLSHKGCVECGIENRSNSKTKTNDKFINEAKLVHGDKYDYSLLIYKTEKTKVKIICPIHGEFDQTPKAHLLGGCRKCGRKICGDKLRTNYSDFIDKVHNIHGNKYDYSLVKYKNMDTKINIICPIHGIFKCTPKHHIYSKSGCSMCNESKGEREIREFLTKNKIRFTYQHKFTNCKNKKELPFDFYLPDYNTCIEYNGKQHYEINHFFGEEAFLLTQKNDKIKMEYCHANNIPLFIIKYDDDVINKLSTNFKTKTTPIN